MHTNVTPQDKWKSKGYRGH